MVLLVMVNTRLGAPPRRPRKRDALLRPLLHEFKYLMLLSDVADSVLTTHQHVGELVLNECMVALLYGAMYYGVYGSCDVCISLGCHQCALNLVIYCDLVTVWVIQVSVQLLGEAEISPQHRTVLRTQNVIMQRVGIEPGTSLVLRAVAMQQEWCIRLMRLYSALRVCPSALLTCC